MVLVSFAQLSLLQFTEGTREEEQDGQEGLDLLSFVRTRTRGTISDKVRRKKENRERIQRKNKIKKQLFFFSFFPHLLLLFPLPLLFLFSPKNLSIFSLLPPKKKLILPPLLLLLLLFTTTPQNQYRKRRRELGS